MLIPFHSSDRILGERGCRVRLMSRRLLVRRVIVTVRYCVCRVPMNYVSRRPLSVGVSTVRMIVVIVGGRRRLRVVSVLVPCRRRLVIPRIRTRWVCVIAIRLFECR